MVWPGGLAGQPKGPQLDPEGPSGFWKDHLCFGVKASTLIITWAVFRWPLPVPTAPLPLSHPEAG